MANSSKNNKKRPTGQKGRPAGDSNASSKSSSSEAGAGSPAASVGGSSSESGSGGVTTTTATVREVSWERRKAWPLLVGGAAALTGLGAVNYTWANPDGRLTKKAQDALSAKYPGSQVRVHGRDAIITGLPAGADANVAHDLVRKLEGVRNVSEELAVPIASGTEAPVESVATETVASGTELPVSSVDTEAVATESVAADTGAALGALATEVAATEVVAAAESETPTVVPTTLGGAATEVPTTVPAPSTSASPAEAPAAALAADAPPVNIHFDSVSSALVGDSQTSVDQLRAFLEANPDVRIKVVGHADTIGTRLTNLAISRARADAVVGALVGAGIDRGRISAFAQGDRVPVESNTTSEGRRANRRVDIVFFGAEGTGDREVAFTG